VKLIENVTCFDLMDQFKEIVGGRRDGKKGLRTKLLDLIELYEKFTNASLLLATLEFSPICDDIEWRENEGKCREEETKLMVFWYINDI
jgi:hypothetical protein